MNLQLAIHSSPRFATWIWLPDWRLLIDAGDGATQHLGYKIRKIDTVALTHAHRDHIGGLLQVINQRGEAGSFAVAHPCGGRSFGMLEAFSNKFNPGSSWRAVWHALEEGDELPGGASGSGERLLKAFRTRHYLDDEPQHAPRSLGYHLLWRTAKVRAEYRELPQAELDAMRAQVGREGITEMVDEKWVTVGGDGAPLKPQDAAGARLLLHEATFLSDADRDSGDEGGPPEDEERERNAAVQSPPRGAANHEANQSASHGHVHSTVEEALRVAREAEVENVVLYHVSTRYTDAHIRDATDEDARRLTAAAAMTAARPKTMSRKATPLFNPRRAALQTMKRTRLQVTAMSIRRSRKRCAWRARRRSRTWCCITFRRATPTRKSATRHVKPRAA